MSGKRKKTDEEKQWLENRKYTNVVCKLSRVCKDRVLLVEIQRTCLVLKQIQLEAWHIANLHVLRCLKNDLELPRLDQTFFNWCCQAARANGIREAKQTADDEEETSDRKRAAKRHPDEHLRDTVRQYRAERQRVEGYVPPPTLKYGGNVMLALAAKMRVNVQNMIALQFEKRLSMFVKLMLEEGSTETAPAFAVNRLVRACYRAKGGEFAEDELQLRKWMGTLMPYEDVIKENLEHFVKKLYEILQVVEASIQKDPSKKGIRAFSLLPYSSSYATAHIVINGSTLHGFCARIFKATGGQNPLNIPLTKTGVLVKKEDVCKQKELLLRRGFAVSQFETMLPTSTISKAVFDEMDHASKTPYASRLFDNQITTNGYSASVLLTRPKNTLELKLEELKDEREEERKKQKISSKKDGNLFDDAWQLLPDKYEADMVIGIDPGMKSLCTAVSEGGICVSQAVVRKKRTKHMLSRQRRQKRRKRIGPTQIAKKRRRQLRKHLKKSRHVDRSPREVDNQLIHSISTREYRHLAGMNKARFWNENLMKREKKYSDAINRIPSYKTASFDSYLERLKIFWEHINFLLEFSAKHAFLKWQFFQSWMKKKTLDAMAKRLIPVASPRVLVGYGDWSRRDRISGHAPTPVEGFREALKKRATVVSIDEFRTSKLCLCCHGSLEKAFLPIKENGDFVLKKTRFVLRCSSGACRATLWNRDVNAARNILSLLKSKFQGLGRPTAFCRA